ncbi:hypothetical protein D8674_042241 [Pyrus ussuriensis x Pyrus communis]|uniref:Uncharacterized protein n=1 Tax=Pyrus ussuriensis x Pyrus communis TaxID=2448454 RepID=A0A5N5GHQ6_9ROSA|nr:hypothetical protein D8674_042241 [Pyrus ussuriensis x Pyrus communis]
MCVCLTCDLQPTDLADKHIALDFASLLCPLRCLQIHLWFHEFSIKLDQEVTCHRLGLGYS